MKMSKKTKVVLYILLTIVALYFLAPFIYMLLTTFKTEGEAIAYPPSLFPEEWHFENYKRGVDFSAVWNLFPEFRAIVLRY